MVQARRPEAPATIGVSAWPETRPSGNASDGSRTMVAAVIATKWSPQTATSSRNAGVQTRALRASQLRKPASAQKVVPMATDSATSGQSQTIAPTVRNPLVPAKCVAEIAMPVTTPATVDARRLRPRIAIDPLAMTVASATTNDSTVGPIRKPDGNGTERAIIAMKWVAQIVMPMTIRLSAPHRRRRARSRDRTE